MGRERDIRCTLKFFDLPTELTKDILWELAIQFGPVVSIALRPEGDTALVQWKDQASMEYAFEALSMAEKNIKLFGKGLRVARIEPRAKRERGDDIELGTGAQFFEIGAKLMVRNVDVSTTAEQISAVFSQYGAFARNPRMLTNEAGDFRGAVVLSYTDFDFSDKALAAMNNNSFNGRTLHIQYSMKTDGSGPHGDQQERDLFAKTGGKTALQLAIDKDKEAAEASKNMQASITSGLATTTSTTNGSNGIGSGSGGEPSWAAGINPYADV